MHTVTADTVSICGTDVAAVGGSLRPEGPHPGGLGWDHQALSCGWDQLQDPELGPELYSSLFHVCQAARPTEMKGGVLCSGETGNEQSR